MKNIAKLLGLLLLFSAFAMTVSAPVQAKKDFTVSTSSTKTNMLKIRYITSIPNIILHSAPTLTKCRKKAVEH